MSTRSPGEPHERMRHAPLAIVGGGRLGCAVGTDAGGAHSTSAPSDGMLGTGELARACRTTVRTVRFYEESGLIEPLDRKDGGHRLFRAGTDQRLQLIMDLREAGLSLQEIKDLFELKAQSRTASEAALAMGEALARRAESLEEKIATLRRLRDDLAAMAAALHECEPCESAHFPERCGACDVMARPDLPRAMRLLWASSKWASSK